MSDFKPGERVVYIGKDARHRGKTLVFDAFVDGGECAYVNGQTMFTPLISNLRKLTPLEQILE